MRPVGYYVHHQGAGHWQRARRIAALLERPCTLIGTFADLDVAGAPGPVLDLADDRIAAGFDGRDGSDERPLGLHYAPLSHPGVRARMARIARWVEDEGPALLVVDVSVEVTILARLLSLPTMVFRLAGSRTDMPHLEAFRAATRLVAPFPEPLEDSETPPWVRAKTYYAGLLAEAATSDASPGDDIVVLLGRGGEGPSAADLAAAARAVPTRRWQVLGEARGVTTEMPPNLMLHGWVGDVPRRLAEAALVVGAAGDGTVAAVAAAGRPFLCLPEPRPHDEQVMKAAGLFRLGAAIVHSGWPQPAAWPDLVARALALDPRRLASLIHPDAMALLAAEIDATADAVETTKLPPASS